MPSDPARLQTSQPELLQTGWDGGFGGFNLTPTRRMSCSTYDTMHFRGGSENFPPQTPIPPATALSLRLKCFPALGGMGGRLRL